MEFGPPSLFERVRYKMRDVTTLYMDGVHFQTRASERNIPDEVMSRLLQFDINEWRVVTASVVSLENAAKYKPEDRNNLHIAVEGNTVGTNLVVDTQAKKVVSREARIYINKWNNEFYGFDMNPYQ